MASLLEDIIRMELAFIISKIRPMEANDV